MIYWLSRYVFWEIKVSLNLYCENKIYFIEFSVNLTFKGIKSVLKYSWAMQFYLLKIDKIVYQKVITLNYEY